MQAATLGPTIRTALVFLLAAVGVVIGASWRYLGSAAFTLGEVALVLSPLAALAILCAYYAAHG